MDKWAEFNVYIYGLVSALITGVLILIRKVLTNEKQIELLKAHIDQQEKYSVERIDGINSQLSEIRSDVKQLMKEK